MAIITVPPKLVFQTVESFKLQRFTNVLRSRFTGQGQRVVYPFAVWMLQAKLKDYAPEDAGPIKSFLAQLDGQANTFRLPVPGYVQPTSGWVPTVGEPYVVTDAPVRATSIHGMFNRANALLFNEGDYFTVNDELKIVTAAVSTDASGGAVVNFKPGLRKPIVASSTSAAARIWVFNPTVLMHAADDDIANWSLRAPVIHGFNFDAIEAIDV